MKRVKLTVAYDGTNYCGWQVQPNGITVQEVLNRHLSELTGETIETIGASRTDAGVHALGNVAVFDTSMRMPGEKFSYALNQRLPEDIRIQKSEEVPLDFHARYSCLGKEYIYQIWNHPVRDPFLAGRALHYWYPMDEALLDRAAKNYVGSHDFSSFCTLDKREKGDLTRTVTEAKVERCGDLVTFTVAADGFLYNMVRIMVGTLLRVQQGKFAPEDIPGIIQAKDRKAAGPTAPAWGLYLNKVFY